MTQTPHGCAHPRIRGGGDGRDGHRRRRAVAIFTIDRFVRSVATRGRGRLVIVILTVVIVIITVAIPTVPSTTATIVVIVVLTIEEKRATGGWPPRATTC